MADRDAIREHLELANENGNAALFLDLVGTLIEKDDTGHLPVDANGKPIVKLLPGVIEKLRPMRNHLIFIITNQSPIKRRRFTRAAVEQAIAEVDRALGDVVTGWEICPHDDADGCECRKPKGGMIVELARTFGVDLKASTVVGDQDIDEQAARAAGAGRFVHARDFFR
jgi:histidinol-phosphate phosphatase family protein